ncbi:hypothetical protein GSI_05017 [Ganoderma sinense ZZ0214-1]|uniref:Uncharacterized protein n=1 Tax=Ganoderma sinense ZZ0214-1 TaxID=1077348 RepID=A0A2G8SGK1_9APHY|nr:hypothetical protein GSI_05017 [Ganoderma sinense ZZ0214-1]
MSSSGPSLTGVDPAAAASDEGSPSMPIQCPKNPSNEMLKRIAFNANPPAAAVKSSRAPAPGTLARSVALLCLYASSAGDSQRLNIITFVNSEALHSVASYTLSDKLLRVSPAQRKDIMTRFNDLVARVLYGFAVWCLSWNAKPRRNIPASEAAKELCRQAFAAPNNSKVQWKFLVFVFGSIPEFWGLKAEVLDIPNAAAFARVKPVPVHRAVLGSSPSLPRPLGSNPATSVYDTHLGPTLSLPNLRSRATVHATSSDEGIIRNTIATRPAAPTFEARNTVSTANTPDRTPVYSPRMRDRASPRRRRDRISFPLRDATTCS